MLPRELLRQLAAQGSEHAFYLEFGGGHAALVFIEHRDAFVEMDNDFLYRGGGQGGELVSHWGNILHILGNNGMGRIPAISG